MVDFLVVFILIECIDDMKLCPILNHKLIIFSISSYKIVDLLPAKVNVTKEKMFFDFSYFYMVYGVVMQIHRRQIIVECSLFFRSRSVHYKIG